jgi:hypothetical protein
VAYVDPGAGSFVLQIVAAGVLTAMFTAKSWWHRARDRARATWAQLRRR